MMFPPFFYMSLKARLLLALVLCALIAFVARWAMGS